MRSAVSNEPGAEPEGEPQIDKGVEGLEEGRRQSHISERKTSRKGGKVTRR